MVNNIIIIIQITRLSLSEKVAVVDGPPSTTFSPRAGAREGKKTPPWPRAGADSCDYDYDDGEKEVEVMEEVKLVKKEKVDGGRGNDGASLRVGSKRQRQAENACRDGRKRSEEYAANCGTNETVPNERNTTTNDRHRNPGKTLRRSSPNKPSP